MARSKPVELIGKRVLVVGLGKSGAASALFLKRRGARVTVSDAKPEDELRSAIPALLDNGITVETGGHGDRTFHGQDLIVVSPGVPVDTPQLQQARSFGVPIIGEVELASRFQSDVFLCKEDGQRSNGKSPLALLGLAAEKGTPLTVEVSGPDEQAALDALAEFLANLHTEDLETT